MDNLNASKKILIIDDEDDLRDILSFQFKNQGYEVVTAEDGVDGLEKLKTIRPDLIILDLNMPNMGGIEFYQKICGPDGHPVHPVMVLTARANTRQLFMEFDVDGFMTKPFEIEDVIKEAEIIIQKSSNGSVTRKHDTIKNVFIIDNDSTALNKISLELLNADYKVSTSTSGTKAIEKMMNDVPDLVLVNLTLTDIPGDIVVQRLSRIAKTSAVRCILYVKKNDQHDNEVLAKFSTKTGVAYCMEYSEPKELLEAFKVLK